MGKLSCTIDSQVNAIDVAVLNAEANHMGELFRSPRTSHRRIGIESVLNFLRHFGAHRSCEDSRCDSSRSDPIPAKVTCHWQHDSVHGTLTGTISDLTSLAFFSSHTAHEENNSLLTLIVHWLVLGHRHSGILGHINGS